MDSGKPPPVRGRARGRKGSQVAESPQKVETPTPTTPTSPTPQTEPTAPPPSTSTSTLQTGPTSPPPSTSTTPQTGPTSPPPSTSISTLQTGPTSPPPSTSTTTPQTEPTTLPPSTSTPATQTVPPAASAAQAGPTPQVVAMEQLKIEGDPTQNPATPLPSTPNKPMKYSFETTKPSWLDSKQSILPNSVNLNLVTNYFNVDVSSTWSLHQYMVTFDPPLEPELTAQRKGIFRSIAAELGGSYLFDGFMAFMIKDIANLPVSYDTVDKKTNGKVKITIDCHKVVDRKDPASFQIYNIFVRKCLDHLKLVEMGRRYYDENMKVPLKQHFLEVWPGFATSLRFFENRLLLNLEIVNKVVRTKNTLEVMNDARQSYNLRDPSEEAKRKWIAGEVEGRIVMTQYNNRTYPIEKILWDEKPTDKFPCKDDSEMDYMTYYKTKYGLQIKNDKQPLLLVAQKERDLRRGIFKRVKLVPETCVLTGLTDAMRSNFSLMKDIGNIAHVSPKDRVKTSVTFLKRLCGNTSIQEEMKKWNIHLNSTELVRVTGKRLKEEEIEQQGKKFPYRDFSTAQNFKNSNKLHDPKELKDWVLVVHKRQEPDVAEFLRKLYQVCKSMGFFVAQPKIYVVVDGFTGTAYLNKIENAITERKGQLSLIFIILPNNRPELYSLLKQELTHKWGIPSQCCLPKNVKDSRSGQPNMSIVTKIGVQLCCKIGGIPWIIKNPLEKRNICVMGFDVYHSGNIGGVSYGAIVATTNSQLSKSCSFVSKHKHREEISSNMGKLITKCLEEFYKVNGNLPSAIFFYRDGVGDGQVDIVYKLEIGSALEAIQDICKRKGVEGDDKPKLTYIIVSKRINTRFMVDLGGDSYGNPPYGTVVDDVVTLHYRYDFFLVSQASDDRRQQGTVSPTSYNVIYDANQLTPAKMQTLSFKLCHNYYNWTGTVSVPSVCQNAHKLAYITGESIRQTCKEDLRHLPFYL